MIPVGFHSWHQSYVLSDCGSRTEMHFDFSGGMIKEMKVLRMTRHVFGGVWSAGPATYALKMIVQTCKSQRPDVSEVIDKSLYIDNCAHSTESLEEAWRLAM